MPKKYSSITDRDKIFAAEYLITLDPVRSALTAGYAKSTALSKAYTWVSDRKYKPSLYDFIDEQKRKRQVRCDITADMVLKEIAKLAFANMDDYTKFEENGSIRHDFSKVDRDKAAPIQEVTVDTFLDRSENEDGVSVRRVKFKLADKISALDKLMKHLNMYSADREAGATKVKLEFTPADLKKMSSAELAKHLQNGIHS